MSRKLKNYDIYLQKLELYAEAANIKLEWKDSDDEGYYMPSANKIKIGTGLEDSVEISTILHELGHHADLSLVSGGDSRSLARAYHNTYNSEVTEKQRELVMECEKKAWDLAEKIAKLLRIKLGKWFYKDKAECLKSYKNN